MYLPPKPCATAFRLKPGPARGPSDRDPGLPGLKHEPNAEKIPWSPPLAPFPRGWILAFYGLKK